MGLVVISQILGSVAGSIFLFWATRYFFKLWVNKKAINEIRQKQSRVSVLKLMLRSRLRKNCNSLSMIFKGETVLIDMFQEKYGSLTHLDLDSAEHYQKIISTLNEIANECENFFEKKLKYPAGSLATQDAMQPKESTAKRDKAFEYKHVISFEFPCLLMIREIILNQTSNRILIERFNEMQTSKKDMMKMPIELKVEDQEVLFDLIDRAHEKKKSEKVGNHRELELHADEHNENSQDEVKSA
jgi:hypothetical protein